MKNNQSAQKDWVYFNIENQPITTSKIVSEVFGKLHQTVMAKIDMLDTASDFFRGNFTEIQYTNEARGSEPVYEMTRDGFGFISMDFTGGQGIEFSHAYIDAFDKIAN